MTRYDDALWDDSDPLYSPHLNWAKPTIAYWTAPKAAVAAGYAIKRERLDGQKGDGQDQNRAARCRRLTREMVRWMEGEGRPADKDTWLYVIGRYRSDDYSPLQEVKANTRAGYIEQIDKIARVIGDTRIEALTYEAAAKIKTAMVTKHRSPDYIKRWFTTLRRVAKYGGALGINGCANAYALLQVIKLPTPVPRDVYPTRDEVEAIVDAADAKGMFAFGTGYLLCYELCLRAVDVRGQWLPGEGGINRDGKRWQDGMTWDMIDPDITVLTKTPSKTMKSMPKAYEWDLTLLPVLQARLKLLKNAGGVGPVITSERSGLPYTLYGWSQAFRRLRDACGVRKELTAMDVRAGGVTEATALVQNPNDLKDAAQHKNLTTTARYQRNRSSGANKVIELRSKRG
ncbi:MAG: recombinase [Vannielia sp.]|uniref:tyrosine-type recombinase/integrase n=1 Tax=Vannielia sp. TaxID=2813045 RepID=UPI003B8DEEAD